MNAFYSVKSKTIKELAAMLDIPVYYKNTGYKRVSKLIRWGSMASGVFADYTFNKADAIFNANNKHLSRVILQSSGIPVPVMGADIFPCVGRPMTHTKGKGFFYCENLEDVKKAHKQGACYFSAFYPKTKEYRVHVGNDTIIAVSEKVGENTFAPKWNFDTGFRFRYIGRSEIPSEAKEIARKAVSALGLHFGAIDIMAYPKDNFLPPFVVCEVNTAPSLSPYGLQKYAEYFQSLLV